MSVRHPSPILSSGDMYLRYVSPKLATDLALRPRPELRLPPLRQGPRTAYPVRLRRCGPPAVQGPAPCGPSACRSASTTRAWSSGARSWPKRRRVLRPDGRLIAVDFENPWDAASRAGALFTRAIERLAGREHYGNGRDFLRRGGLRGFLRENGFVEVARRDVPIGSLSVVVARVDCGCALAICRPRSKMGSNYPIFELPEIDQRRLK